jgi:acetylornithine deacetylase
MGRGRTAREYTEGPLADFLAEVLKRHRIDVEVQTVSAGRPNVLGYIDVRAAQTLMLEAHLDTVQADGMAIEPFNPIVRDGKLYGRGSCDTKGSIASFLQAVIDVLESGRKPRYNVLLLFVSDEEYLFSGARHAVRSGLRADFGIAGEPTRLRIVRAHKGVTRWKVVTKGQAAHSAYPEQGRNAIYGMSKVVVRLEEYAAQLALGKRHPLLGSATLSIGVIEGGQAVNVVPDRCWIEIDRRTLPGETVESVVEDVSSSLHGLPDWEFVPTHLSVSGMEVAESQTVVRMLLEAGRGVPGACAIESAHYATDAGIYNSFGIPTVVFGPGDIAQAHTGTEFIELQQVHDGVRIIEKLVTT